MARPGEGHTWKPWGHVVQGPGVAEVGLQGVDVGLTHHSLLAEVPVVYHLQHERQRVGRLRRHELQPGEFSVRPPQRSGCPALASPRPSYQCEEED